MSSTHPGESTAQRPVAKPRARTKRKDLTADEQAKRRCVSTACIACRKRKSKCDGNLPACAACSSVYYTECVYDPNSDHRRKGVYRKDDKLRTRTTTLEVLIHALLNEPEDDALDLVRQIRACESLDSVAEKILTKKQHEEENEDFDISIDESHVGSPTLESQLSSKMGELRVEDGSARYIGGTSNLLFLSTGDQDFVDPATQALDMYSYETDQDPITSWSNVTQDPDLIKHLLKMYFTWHYPYFTTLSRNLFLRDFHLGRRKCALARRTEYCTPLLVNAMLALGSHFTGWPAAREVKEDSSTAGDHFFKEAKRLIMVNDEYERPKLATVQALALMSVREAGCGRESKGWSYSGMSFRLASDLGLHLDSGLIQGAKDGLDEEEIDARRITFWGCFLFDKCWSNYLGRLPQLPLSNVTVPKFDVFPGEDSDIWAAYTDSGSNQAHAQPSRTRAVALQISALCEISGDLMINFYNPIDLDKNRGKQGELKKLSDIHQRLETWRRNLPVEMEPKEGGLPNMLVMHMFFQLLYIHLFRPFLKYNQATSPLPPSVSPRRLCTQAATAISKLLRLYKRSHGLRQICNIVVYITHSACTIHLLNLPDKNARRDITHGVKHLEEIAESWLCARRTLAILSVLARQWNVDLPDEAAAVLSRTDVKFAAWNKDIQARYPSKPNSASPESTPPQHIIQPSPNFFTRIAPGEAPVNFISSSEAMTARSELSPPTTSLPLASARSPPTPRVSIDSGQSPSALFAGSEQVMRADGGDWWVKDQNQLAVGFGQWPAEDHSVWRTVTSAVPDITTTSSASFMADGALAGLFRQVNGSNGLPGSMSYPNENEWYQ